MTKRELHLLLCEVGETISAFAYAEELMKSLKSGSITQEQFSMFSGDLKRHCAIFGVPTANEFVSLF